MGTGTATAAEAASGSGGHRPRLPPVGCARRPAGCAPEAGGSPRSSACEARRPPPRGPLVTAAVPLPWGPAGEAVAASRRERRPEAAAGPGAEQHRARPAAAGARRLPAAGGGPARPAAAGQLARRGPCPRWAELELPGRASTACPSRLVFRGRFSLSAAGAAGSAALVQSGPPPWRGAAPAGTSAGEGRRGEARRDGAGGGAGSRPSEAPPAGPSARFPRRLEGGVEAAGAEDLGARVRGPAST